MYTQFFRLTENPFRLTPDPRFLFFTTKHRECLSALVYSVLGRKGFMMMTGDAGTGKTTLIHALLGMLGQKHVSCAFIFHPLLEPTEFLEYVLADLGVVAPSTQKGEMLRALHNFLLKRHQEGSTTALIIDEAHKLTPVLLEEIRLFSNLETSREKLLQIVLAGQNELEDLFRREDLRQLKQRIGLRSRLEPFSAEQTADYLQHRLGLCGRAATELFPPKVLAVVHEYSRGLPRLINSICDNALLLAFAQQMPAVTEETVAEVAADLDLLVEAPPPVETPMGLAAPSNPPASYGPFPLKMLESYGERKRTMNILSRWADKFRLQ